MKISTKVLITRKIIVLGWILLLGLILYLPNFIPLFFAHKTINILVWPGIFSSQVIDDFQKESGIRVNISYFDSNEELLTKIKATNGEGYDLILPTDYGAYNLIKNKLLKPIDRQKLNFWSRINPIFLNHYFDPQNQYTIPVSWDVLGLGYNKNLISQILNPSWRYIFDPKFLVNSGIIMTNDALEAILISSIYLYGSPEAIDKTKLNSIEKLLKTQKPIVKAYTEFRPDYYLITKNANIALMASIYLWRSKTIYPELDFVMPEEGTLLTIESLAIPKRSNKENLIYKFINYLYEPKIIKRHLSQYTLLPVTNENVEGLVISDLVKKMFSIKREELNKFNFMKYDYFREPITESTIQNSWIEVKA